jgi:hypothetical protein
VKSKPQHGNPAGDAFLAVQSLARGTGGDVQELLTLYVLEAPLGRVAVSEFREDFVLKGGVLLATFDLRRPTKDIDLQAAGIPNDVEAVTTRIKEIAGIHVDAGVVFDLASVSAQTIRDEDEYSGVRVRIVGMVGRSVLPVGIDVNFGDPIWPEPTETVLPRLLDLGQKPVLLLGYPLPMVIAEKTVTAIQRGQAEIAQSGSGLAALDLGTSLEIRERSAGFGGPGRAPGGFAMTVERPDFWSSGGCYPGRRPSNSRTLVA